MDTSIQGQTSQNQSFIVSDMLNISTTDEDKMPLTNDRCVFCAVLSAIVGLVTIIVNIFNIIILMDELVLKKPTRVLLLSVSLADLMVGVIVMFYIYPGYTGSWTLNKHFCEALGVVLYLSLYVSIWSLCCLSVDRYMALREPLKYHVIMCMKYVYIVVATNWILGAVLASLPLFGVGEYHFNTAERICGISTRRPHIYSYIIYIYILPAFLLTYVLSFLVLRIVKLEVGRGSSNNNQTSDQLRYVQTRASIMIALIVLAFTIAWLPELIGNLVQSLWEPIPPYAEYAIWWLAVSNSFFNFFIYCVTNREYRKRLVWLLICRCHHWKRQVSREVYQSVRLRLQDNAHRRRSTDCHNVNDPINAGNNC